MRMVVRGLIGLGVVLVGATAASAQVIGTFAWQTQPYCNVVTVTVIQQGAQYQLTGYDNLCGAGPAPVTGTAVPAGGGVRFGFAVARPDGRAAHLSATITLAGLSGTWLDDDGRSGAFAFGGSATGAPRPAPAGVAAPRLTAVTYAGVVTSAGGTVSPPVLLRQVGSFTSSGGPLRVTWNSHVATLAPSTGGGCNFQVRIDGQAAGPAGLGGLSPDATVLIAEGRADAPVTASMWFTSVASGTHTLEIWVRSVSAQCSDNPGNFDRQVMVEEYRAP